MSFHKNVWWHSHIIHDHKIVSVDLVSAVADIIPQPYFDDINPRNIAIVVDETVTLKCRVKNKGNRTVSIAFKNHHHIPNLHILNVLGFMDTQKGLAYSNIRQIYIYRWSKVHSGPSGRNWWLGLENKFCTTKRQWHLWVPSEHRA